MGGGLQATVLDTTSVPPTAPVAPVASSKNADLIAIRGTSELATSPGTGDPEAGQREPKGAQGGTPKEPKGTPKEPKGTPKEPKGAPKELSE